MPQVCTVCSHPERASIDASLCVGSGTGRSLASRFGRVEVGVRRHRQEHLPAALVKAAEAAEVAEADSLLEQVQALQARALSILDRSEQAGDLRTALSAIREARECLQLLGRLAGELQDGTTINVIAAPQWIQLRAVIVMALADFPEARRRIVDSLEGIGG